MTTHLGHLLLLLLGLLINLRRIISKRKTIIELLQKIRMEWTKEEIVSKNVVGRVRRMGGKLLILILILVIMAESAVEFRPVVLRFEVIIISHLGCRIQCESGSGFEGGRCIGWHQDWQQVSRAGVHQHI